MIDGKKPSLLGPIPTDWVCDELESFTSFISYGFTNPMPTTQSGPYMVTAADVSDGRINYSTARRTSIEAFETKLTSKSKPRKNDILLTKDGALGRVALVGDETICINQSVAILRPNKRIDPPFFNHLLQADLYQKKMLEDAGGSTIKHIYITIVNHMPIAVPESMAEQQAIAAALSDADGVVAGLERVIAKKRLIKQGAMQDLLTARRRLPGFSGEWEVKRLGTLAKIARGASPRPIESPIWFDESSTVGWVRISDLSKSAMYLTATSQRLSQEGIKRSRRVEIDSLIMSIAATLGRPAITKVDTCIHDGFVVLTDLRVEKHFLFHLLKSLEPTWATQGQTGSQMNLNTAIIEEREVLVPPTGDEQRSIAAVFDDMDAEIHTLESRLAKARAVKEGMMQNLLTGRVRLV